MEESVLQHVIELGLMFYKVSTVHGARLPGTNRSMCNREDTGLISAPGAAYSSPGTSLLNM